MSRTVSLCLSDDLVTRIGFFAHTLGNGVTFRDASIILLEEALRKAEFSGIEFLNTSIGREPFLKQTGMAVWEFIMVSKGFYMEAEPTAEYLQCSVEKVKLALAYYDAYHEEIDQDLQNNDMGEEGLKRLFPNLQVFIVSA